jgi:hypothetical protein
MSDSDLAELSTLRAQISDVVERVVEIGERYDNSPDSAVASDVVAAERALLTARRSLDQAIAHLER